MHKLAGWKCCPVNAVPLNNPSGYCWINVSAPWGWVTSQQVISVPTMGMALVTHLHYLPTCLPSFLPYFLLVSQFLAGVYLFGNYQNTETQQDVQQMLLVVVRSPYFASERWCFECRCCWQGLDLGENEAEGLGHRTERETPLGKERQTKTKVQRGQACGIGQVSFSLWVCWENETQKGKPCSMENRMQKWLKFHWLRSVSLLFIIVSPELSWMFPPIFNPVYSCFLNQSFIWWG